MAKAKAKPVVQEEKKVSSIIQGILYDAKTKVLTITFVTGKVYRYLKVQPAIAESLITADSQGMAFHRFIRGKFTTELVQEEKK